MLKFVTGTAYSTPSLATAAEEKAGGIQIDSRQWSTVRG